MDNLSGASSMIGIILIFTIGFGAVGLITLSSYPLLQSQQSQAQIQEAIQSFSILDSRISRVGLGTSQAQSISVDLGGGSIWIQNRSWMNITIYNKTHPLNPLLENSFNISMGSLVYRNGNTVLGFESGGIFMIHPDGSQSLISNPEFHYRGIRGQTRTYTLVLPVIRILGEGSLSGSGPATIQIQRDFTQLKYSGALSNSSVHVTISSPFCQGWREYFEALENQGYLHIIYDRCEIDNTLSLVLITPQPQSQSPFSHAIAVTGTDEKRGEGKLEVQQNAIITSYNSSRSSCGSSPSYKASIYTGEIVVQQNAQVHGNITAFRSGTKSVDLQNFAWVNGSVITNGEIDVHQDVIVNGSLYTPSEIQEIDKGSKILGDVTAHIIDKIYKADVNGSIFCSNYVRIDKKYDCKSFDGQTVTVDGRSYRIEYTDEIQGLEYVEPLNVDELVNSKISEYSKLGDYDEVLGGGCEIKGDDIEIWGECTLIDSEDGIEAKISCTQLPGASASKPSIKDVYTEPEFVISEGWQCRLFPVRKGEKYLGYYFSKIELKDGAKLILDTTDGPIEIALSRKALKDGKITFHQDSNLSVNAISPGSYTCPTLHPARFFMGEGSTIDLQQHAELTNNAYLPDCGMYNPSYLLQFWMSSEADNAVLQQNVKFYGVIYAAKNKKIDIQQASMVCGAVVGGKVVIQQHQRFWYDDYLGTMGLEKLLGSSEQPSGYVQYLHITENGIELKLS